MKKRIFLILALAAALLMASAATALATEAASEDGHTHWAWCDEPNVCAVCGESCFGIDIRHNPEYIDYWVPGNCHGWECTACGYRVEEEEHTLVYLHDDVYHWPVCEKCGETLGGQFEHFAYCSSRNVCAVCGIPYSGNNIIHDSGDNPWQFNETEHWSVCAVCSEPGPAEKHSATCTNPTECQVCHAPYSGDNIIHGAAVQQIDETYHRDVCSLCSAVIYEGIHWATCTNPTVCAECGTPYSGNDIQHEWNETYEYDETKHWAYCSRCNEKIYENMHVSWCNNPNVCAECGAPYPGSYTWHDWSANYEYDETEHWAYCSLCKKKVERAEHQAACNKPGVCEVCGAPYSGNDIQHDWSANYKYNETEHWKVCPRCDEVLIQEEHYAWCNKPGTCAECGAAYTGSNATHEFTEWSSDAQYHWTECSRCGTVDKGEHWAICDRLGQCFWCDAPYTGSNIDHYYDDEAGYQYDETTHWFICSKCKEKADINGHSFDTNGVCEVCGYEKTAVQVTATPVPSAAPSPTPTASPTAAPSSAPTASPTAAPSSVPTASPTATPVPSPTPVPHEHTWTVTAETASTCEKEGSITYSCACGETKTEAVKALGHVFSAYVSQGNGTHRSKCERCSVFTVKNCTMKGQAVNGVSCSVCSVCGYTKVPELTGIELPEETMANVSAVTAEGEAVSVQVLDLTPSLPENTGMALCLRVMPETGAALPGGVQITIPCSLDTANLRLVFLSDGEAPVEVPFEVVDGMITFAVTAPGVFALVPVQE